MHIIPSWTKNLEPEWFTQKTSHNSNKHTNAQLIDWATDFNDNPPPLAQYNNFTSSINNNFLSNPVCFCDSENQALLFAETPLGLTYDSTSNICLIDDYLHTLNNVNSSNINENYNNCVNITKLLTDICVACLSIFNGDFHEKNPVSNKISFAGVRYISSTITKCITDTLTLSDNFFYKNHSTTPTSTFFHLGNVTVTIDYQSLLAPTDNTLKTVDEVWKTIYDHIKDVSRAYLINTIIILGSPNNTSK